jgi:hypothetical protein
MNTPTNNTLPAVFRDGQIHITLASFGFCVPDSTPCLYDLSSPSSFLLPLSVPSVLSVVKY